MNREFCKPNTSSSVEGAANREIGKRSLVRATATVLCAVALLLAACFEAPASRAYADDEPSYTIGATVDNQYLSVASGAFNVSVDLARVGATEYPMYAFSATIRWDNNALSLVRYDAGDLDAYVTDYDGYSEIVLNYMSDALEGTTWKSPQTVLTLTFKPGWAGTSAISFERVNVADSTGLGSFECVSTDASLTIMKAWGGVDYSGAASSSSTSSNPVSSAIAALGDGFPFVVAAFAVLVAACVVLIVRRKNAK